MRPLRDVGIRARPWVWLLAIALFGLAGCAALPASTAPVVRIGLVAPFEGHHREIGYDVIYSGRLATREWNARGGVEGVRVELVAIDDGGDTESALRAAYSLALDPMVVGVLGHWLDETTAAARPIYRDAGLPFVEMSAADQFEGTMPKGFVENYENVTPFGETPGSYAVPAYNVCNRLVAAIGQSILADGKPTRSGVALALSDQSVDQAPR